MKAVVRYSLLITAIVILFVFYNNSPNENVPIDVAVDEFFDEELYQHLPANYTSFKSHDECKDCFDYSRCTNSFKVYVYPDIAGLTRSEVYSKILKSIRSSVYYTENYLEACLFVLSIDTIDRDRRSENYIGDLDGLIASLPADIWNEGRNHLIFNLYHGTYPDYSDENLGFNHGYAIIARASANEKKFRFGFDVSFPLFHKEHPLRSTFRQDRVITGKDNYLVSFKGKRYVYGIGSETRDTLHHLHNGETIAMVTTCKHNNDWKAHQDNRCERDNAEYEKWDYVGTMANSTFCLTPRGRRLSSFRFLESLRFGCIPVVLSDGWVLPYAEVIDWSGAVLVIPEKNVLLVPDILFTISNQKVRSLKERGQFLYQRYFSSVEKITLTTLEIIHERIRRRSALGSDVNWNSLIPVELDNSSKVTVVVRTVDKSSSRLQRVVRIVAGLGDELNQVIVLWSEARGSAPIGASMDLKTSPDFVMINHETLNFSSVAQVLKQTSGVLLYVDERSEPTLLELRALVEAAKKYPTKLIGVQGLNYDVESNTLSLSAVLSTPFNAIYPSMFAMRRNLFTHMLNTFASSSVVIGCESSVLNIYFGDMLEGVALVGHRTQEQWMRIEKELACYKKLLSQWDEGVPLADGFRISNV